MPPPHGSRSPCAGATVVSVCSWAGDAGDDLGVLVAHVREHQLAGEVEVVVAVVVPHRRAEAAGQGERLQPALLGPGVEDHGGVGRADTSAFEGPSVLCSAGASGTWTSVVSAKVVPACSTSGSASYVGSVSHPVLRPSTAGGQAAQRMASRTASATTRSCQAMPLPLKSTRPVGTGSTSPPGDVRPTGRGRPRRSPRPPPPGRRRRTRAGRSRRPRPRPSTNPTKATSTSAASASCDPTAATRVRARTSEESKTGVRAVVAQTTTSADPQRVGDAGVVRREQGGPRGGTVRRERHPVRRPDDERDRSEGDLRRQRVDVPDALGPGAEDDHLLGSRWRGGARAGARRRWWPACAGW